MSTNEDPGNPVRLTEALEDYSAEGAEILYSEPAPLIRASIYLVALLVGVALIWSFIGHADVVVAANGVVAPEDDVRRVYVPIEGELDRILVTEGDPVAKGDELARISSRRAIQLAAEAREAELKLSEVAFELEQFPARLQLLEQQIAQGEREVQRKEADLDRQLRFGEDTLRQQQLAELQQARADLNNSRNRKEELAKRLRGERELENRGVSSVQVEATRVQFEAARAAYQLAEANLRKLESRFIEQTAQQGVDLANLRAQLDGQRIDLDTLRLQVEQAPREIQIRFDMAQAEAEALRQIRFEITADSNMIVVLSPVSGVVTQVAFNQPGDKVAASSPLVNIAPERTRKILKIQLAERDGGFVQEGMPVKMKFAAFPYQRYGFIDGTLEYISPTTVPPAPGAMPVYEGHVSLAQEYVDTPDGERALRYGMSAIAEVVVRERRLIDMAIDPLRGG